MKAFVRVALVGVMAGATVGPTRALQSQRAAPQGYIAGVVRGSQGPEAGVWVIAETKELPTNFIKIVVTDDQGRFSVPELPEATYSVWVRGYGLVDSTPIRMKPGTSEVTLTATPAGTPQEAAKVYPGNYWLSLLEPPAASEFPGTGPQRCPAARRICWSQLRIAGRRRRTRPEARGRACRSSLRGCGGARAPSGPWKDSGSGGARAARLTSSPARARRRAGRRGSTGCGSCSRARGDPGSTERAPRRARTAS